MSSVAYEFCAVPFPGRSGSIPAKPLEALRTDGGQGGWQCQDGTKRFIPQHTYYAGDGRT